VTNAEVSQKTNTKDNVALDQRRWAHATSMWDVRIGERTGRPKTRWADTFKRVVGQWSRRAKNRGEWSILTQHQ
jgi:hypothetical protein